MKLYVNGDSHTAAAEAVNLHAFAEDDGRYFYLGRAPHPDNIAVSWGKRLSEVLKAAFHCDAESASSNTRIIRTTREWINNNSPHLDQVLIIIQWSTWERQEWVDSLGRYYQVNASGIDDVPPELQQRYREFVANVNWHECNQRAHQEIWEFHQELVAQGIRHVMFNGNNHFQNTEKRDWGTSYIAPYDSDKTFNSILRSNNFETVSPKSWHFGKDAHVFWSRFMLQYITVNQLLA